jgi:hypothetical protein
MGLRPGGNEGMAISLLGRAPGELGEGITIASPQEGQLISLPAPELSTANSCSHLGQLKMTSIISLS